MQTFFNSEAKFGCEAVAHMRLKFTLSKMVVQHFHLHMESREMCFRNLSYAQKPTVLK